MQSKQGESLLLCFPQSSRNLYTVRSSAQRWPHSTLVPGRGSPRNRPPRTRRQVHMAASAPTVVLMSLALIPLVATSPCAGKFPRCCCMRRRWTVHTDSCDIACSVMRQGPCLQMCPLCLFRAPSRIEPRTKQVQARSLARSKRRRGCSPHFDCAAAMRRRRSLFVETCDISRFIGKSPVEDRSCDGYWARLQASDAPQLFLFSVSLLLRIGFQEAAWQTVMRWL